MRTFYCLFGVRRGGKVGGVRDRRRVLGMEAEKLGMGVLLERKRATFTMVF